MMRIRLYVTWLIKLGTTTPQGRAVTFTTGLLIAVAAITYTFAANSYYVSLSAPDIQDASLNITISQGRPWLPPMGLEPEWVDSGISITEIEDAQRSKVRNEELEGFWLEPDEGDYRQWAKDVAEVLKVERAASMRWYLGDKEKAVSMLVQETTNPQDSASRQESALALGQIMATHPEFVEPHIDQLVALLSHQDPNIASSAISSLSKVFVANPELAQPHLDKLILLLSNSDSDISDRAQSTLEKVFSAKPELAQPHLNQFSDLLSDSDPNIVRAAISSFGGVLADNPELARPYIKKLVDLLSDSNAGYSARSTLQDVFSANPELAQSHLDKLIPSTFPFRLRHKRSCGIYSTTGILG